MTDIPTNILDRIEKLLNLKRSDNQEEAALAAARAAELMARYQIDEAVVRVRQGAKPQADDVIEGTDGRKFSNVERWRAGLASGIADGLGCRHYWANAGLAPVQTKWVKNEDGSRKTSYKRQHVVKFIGRKSDADTAAYLFQYIGNEIERLCQEEYKRLPDWKRPIAAKATAWFNGFKWGAAQTIGRRMNEKRAETRKAAEKHATQEVTQALALIKQDEQAIESYVKKLKLRSMSGATSLGDRSAYSAGADAAKSINLDGGGHGLGAGAKQLKS